MSGEFQIYFETKDIIATNIPEDNLEIFSQILSALHENLQSGTLQQQYSYTERDLETFEEVEVTINMQELLEEILDLFSKYIAPHIFSNYIHDLITELESINSSNVTQLLALLNEYTYNPDTELPFEMDEDQTQPIAYSSSINSTTHIESTQERSASPDLNLIYQRMRAISIDSHKSTEPIAVSWKNSGEYFALKLIGKTPPHDDHSGGGII